MLFVDDMDDWKLKVRPVVKLEEKPNVFVSLLLIALTFILPVTLIAESAESAPIQHTNY